jgi:hypothetical protein
MLPQGHSTVILSPIPMSNRFPPRSPGRLGLAAHALVLLFATGFGAVRANVLGVGDRFDRLVSRVETFLDPPPQRSTLPTVVVTPAPSVNPTPTRSITPEPSTRATPSATPLVRTPVDVDLAGDPAAVFASQLTNEDCAVAATQMVLAILGLGDTSPGLQQGIKDRIGEWEAFEDSQNGGWGPAAVGLALADHGATGYQVHAYDTYTDALRDSAIAISTFDKPVVMFPWWGAHSWVMTGYRADADPTLFDDARISGAYILDPWYPRVSSIWGASDPPGNFEDLGELERNWPAYQGPPGYETVGPGWTRPEGRYPDRDGRFVILVPTTPRSPSAGGAAP